MIVTHEEALNKHCCSYNQMCVGNQCMAWKAHLIPVPHEVSPFMRTLAPALVKFMDSGKGYCGLVRHG